VILLLTALVSAACSDLPNAEFDAPEGFVPLVADSNDNVGLGNDIAVGSDGVPYVSYFGFEAVLEPGEIPVSRPVGAPFNPSVNLASVADDGAWTLGAVAQATEFSNVPVPFGPILVESLASLEPDNANGTSIAVGEDGARHVAWASNNGIWHASSTDSSSVEQISAIVPVLNVAGPIGRPGIAVDGNIPWVAWTRSVVGGQEVLVATLRTKGWTQDVVATIDCNGCPAPLATEVGIVSSGPIVLFVDQAAGSVMAARLEGTGWVSETVTTDVAGLGLSLDVDDQGTARASYYTGDGTVEMAVSDGASWNTTDVGESGELDPGTGNFAPASGIAVDSAGAVHVAWYDAGSGSVRLAREADGLFEEVETLGTEGGRYPSLAAGPRGRVYLAWYDVTTEDLLVGVLGEIGTLLVAQPSPTPAIVGPVVGTCEPDGTELQIVAFNTTFDLTCLAVERKQPFKVILDNRDIFAHNFSIYTDDSFALDAALENFTTPLDQSLVSTVRPLPFGGIDEAGTYFFQCDFHPIPAMRGTFIVGSGGGGGGQ